MPGGDYMKGLQGVGDSMMTVVSFSMENVRGGLCRRWLIGPNGCLEIGGISLCGFEPIGKLSNSISSPH